MNSSWIINATLYLLTFMSFMSWSIFLCKFLVGWQSQRMTQRYLTEHWHAPTWQAISTTSSSGYGELAQLAVAGVVICHECADDKLTTEEMYVMVSAGLGQEIKRLTRQRESWLSMLASTSSIAPFVGLFGTVWGIMHALVVIGETGQASIAVVAGPIGEALIATAIGIATAVPAVIFYNILMRKARVHVTDLEAFAERFLRFAIKHRQQWRSAS